MFAAGNMEELDVGCVTSVSVSCANCNSLFDWSKDVKPSSSIYELLDLKSWQMKKLSTLEALRLILKGQKLSSVSPQPNSNTVKDDLSLCSGCRIRFTKLIHLYQDFLSLTHKDSFVRNLANVVQQEPPPSKMQKVKIRLMQMNRKEPSSSSISPERKLAFAKVVLPPSSSFPRKSAFAETSKKVGLSPRQLSIRQGLELFPENMETECNPGDFDLGPHEEGSLITDRVPPVLQSEKKRQDRGVKKEKTNSEKKNPRKRIKKKYTPDPLGVKRKASLPSSLSEEDQKLLITTSYKCDVCVDPPQAFNNFRDWVLHHLETHQLDLGYGDSEEIRNRADLIPCNGLRRPCPECGKKFQNNTLMLYHIKLKHFQQFTVSCDICGKKFLKEATLQKHIEMGHSSTFPFLCTLCGSTFKTKSGLDNHEKIHLGIAQKKYSCHLCPGKYWTNRDLKTHIASHSNERPFQCPHCPVTLKTPQNLKSHVAYNHDASKGEELGHFCEFCGKGYRWNRKASLKEHLISVHHLSNEAAMASAKMKAKVFRILANGERVLPQIQTKPKTCSICERTFVRREALFTHLISVHGKTPEEAKEMTGLESTRLEKIIPKSMRATAT